MFKEVIATRSMKPGAKSKCSIALYQTKDQRGRVGLNFPIETLATAGLKPKDCVRLWVDDEARCIKIQKADRGYTLSPQKGSTGRAISCRITLTNGPMFQGWFNVQTKFIEKSVTTGVDWVVIEF